MKHEELLSTRLGEEIGAWAVGVAETKDLAPTKKLADLLSEISKLEQHTDDGRKVAVKQPIHANDEQVGGDHYKHPGEEEHWDRAWRLNYDCFQYIITKWVERWKVKGGVQDLKKARHAIDKYIEVVKGTNIDGLATQADPPSAIASQQPAKSLFEDKVEMRGQKEPEEPDIVYQGTKINYDNQCICGSLNPKDPNWVHTEECPARNKLSHPTPAERKWQMDGIFQRLDNVEKEVAEMKKHWQGGFDLKRESVIDKDSNVRSNDYFTYEGGKANEDHWRCNACKEHFTTGVGQAPGRAHGCGGAEPGAGYVDQG